MPSLYEINQAIMDCLDSETGEVINPEALDALAMQKDEKIEGITLWIKNLRSDALAYKAEEEAFAKRRKAAEKKADSLTQYLANALEGQKFNTAKCAISFRRSEKLDIYDEDHAWAFLPRVYVREKTIYEPDKAAIKEAIKSGVEIAGCRLVESLNAQIK
jgi:hypothetical protein